MYGMCSQCDVSFNTQEDFISHSCVIESKSLSQVERLERLLESGGCSSQLLTKFNWKFPFSQEYYDTQTNK
jgi:hypothetical protein